jgi:hypothetical protein
VVGRAALGLALWGLAGWWPAAPAAAAECAGSASAADLDAFFRADDAAGLAGADYPHAIALPDGRTLWYFQDAFVGRDVQLWGDRFAHNAAMVQDGACFELLTAPGGGGTSWIGSWVENDLQNWVWLLDAEVGADGHLWVFLAEVHNPNGRGAAHGARPVGTWTARVSLPDLRLVGMQEAPDASHSLFGYSIVSDSRWTYLYGHCYRQFDGAETIGFDPDCSPYAYLARVPKGQLGRELEYWSEEGWTRDRAARTPVFTAEQSMPVSVERFGDVYVAASDENDWFGHDVVISTAPAPQGPWTEVLRYTPETRCGEACNNYGAFVLPELDGDQVVIAQSNNAWNMEEAFADASRYRIGVRAVTVPGVSAASLSREPSLALAEADTAFGDASAAPSGRAAEVEAPEEADAADRADAAAPAAEPAADPSGARPPNEASPLTATVTGSLRWATVMAWVAGLGALVLAGSLTLGATAGLVRAVESSRPRRRLALTRLRAVGATRRHGPASGPSVP